MYITRRNFFRTVSYSSIGLSSFPFFTTGCSFSESKKQRNSTLYSHFITPPNSAKPFVRWWWNGNRLSREEILRELDVLKEAGIGGVEINPIKFPGGDTLGIDSLTWLSEQWIDMLEIAVEGAHKRGIECDIIVGSGWPFGGEFLEKEEQTQILALGTRDLKGADVISFTKQELLDEVELEIHSKYEPFYKEVYSVRLVPKHMDDFQQGEDITDQFDGDTLRVKLPEGDYVLYIMVLATGYQAVINGAPGAAGPVLNHYDKSAVIRYLNRMSEALNTRFGKLGSAFRSMFCDSLELEGANWCIDMEEEFEKRRGYSLIPYLPFVLFKVGHMGNPVTEHYGSDLKGEAVEEIKRVRYDFYITRLELFRERFIDTYQTWCEENGVKSRIQAYGRGYHPLEANMLIDIPEGETWFNPVTGGETLINKFVASGSRLAGKKLVSCEEITNTGFVFFATLEQIKVTGDLSNLSGINHSILHGYNYSPPDAEFPGWVRYGTYFNERNPWWPYFKHWTEYKSRISCLFQEATARADIAVMHPLSDIWMDLGPQRLPFPRDEHPSYQHQLWKAIHQNGNTCDYISENILQDGKVERGALVYNGRSYHTLMLMEVESLQPETARAMVLFAESGGRILFIGKTPSKSPGRANYKENTAFVSGAMKEITTGNTSHCALVDAPGEDIVGWYKDIQKQFNIKSAVKIGQPTQDISQVHYTHGDKEIFFFANASKKKHYSVKAQFNTGSKIPWLWNAETGKRYLYPYEENRNQLTLSLEPAGSKLIVFDTLQEGEPLPLAKADPATARLISGAWDVELNHADGSHETITLDNLIDFKNDDALKTFAGTAIYSKTIVMDHQKSWVFLDLGEVHGISEVWVNDKPAGYKWYGDHRYEVAEYLIAGENSLKIKLTTVLGNYCKSLENNDIAQRWTRNQPYHSVGLTGPVKLLMRM